MSGRTRTRAALGLSAAAHAVLFAALLLAVRPERVATPMVVRLLELPGRAAAAVPGDSPRAAGASAPARVAPALHPSLQRGAAEAKAVAVVEASSLAARPSEPAAEGSAHGESQTRGVEAQGLEALEGREPGALGLPGGGGSARLGELHRRLAEAAARCYPAAARRFRLQGVVPVHFCLDARGGASALSLQGSTGSALLDRSALECVVPGAQPLDGFEGCFLVPVRFGS